MKVQSGRFLSAFLLILSTGISMQAQKKVDYEAEGGLIQFNLFKFEGSKECDLKFPLSNQTDKLNLEIKAYISSGELAIEIFDPAGEKQGNFSVRGQISLNKAFKKNEIFRSSEMITTKIRMEKNPWILNEEWFKAMGMGSRVAQASISRSFRNPIKGDWVIKISCKNAKGCFTLENNGKLLRDTYTKYVNGVVLDNKNQPISGAIIRIKEESGWSTSDDKGNFTVPIRETTETIVIQYKRMIPKEIVIGDQPNINVVLEPQK